MLGLISFFGFKNFISRLIEQSNVMYYIAGFIRMCSDVKNNSSQKGKLHNTLQGLTLAGFFLVLLSISQAKISTRVNYYSTLT